MAVSRFKHFCSDPKVLTVWGLLLLIGATILLLQHSMTSTSTPVIAGSKPAVLTSIMQKCLRRNVEEAMYAVAFAEESAGRHVGEDIGKAGALAYVEVFKRNCDLRPHEVNAAFEYLIAEEKRGF